MTRVCPKRDAACPHGDNCPYSIDRYECRDHEPKPAATPIGYRWQGPHGGWIFDTVKPRWPAEALYVASPPDQTAEIARWKAIMRDNHEAFAAMRATINERLPMPSEESDLLTGPELSVSCAVVAKAVVERIDALEAEIARLLDVQAVARATRARATRKLKALVEWLEEDEDNPTLLIASMTQEEIDATRSVLAGNKL